MAVRTICLVSAGSDTRCIVIRKRRAVSGAWVLPGGVIAYDEEPYDTAVRIVSEELGIEVPLSEVTVCGEKRRATRGSHTRHYRHFTICSIMLGEEQLSLIPQWNAKGDTVRVIKRTEIKTYLSKSQQSFLGGLT